MNCAPSGTSEPVLQKCQLNLAVLAVNLRVAQVGCGDVEGMEFADAVASSYENVSKLLSK
jgi:hypothetical protein